MSVAGTSNLPVAPLATPWNDTAARQRIFEHCGRSVASLSRAFLWRHPGVDARDPQAWEMAFCDVIDGRLHIVPKAIAACAGTRGLGLFKADEQDVARVRARIVTIYQRVRRMHPTWPASPFAVVADATGTPVEGPIAFEGVQTGDGRFIRTEALTWDEGPWPLVFDLAEMDHSGATVGTINSIERREGGVIWGTGNLSSSDNPEIQALVTRAEELFAEGAVGVSISLDDIEDNSEEVFDDPDKPLEVISARIRSVAIVDEAAFSEAKMGLVAAVRAVRSDWFTDPGFTDDDERLVPQEPERPEEERQLGCPLTITDEGRIFGHAALWGRCHIGYPGTCVRPPKEPAAYRGFLTGERVPGIPTGPLVMRTTHASLKVSAEDAQIHYDNTGYAVGDVTVGADRYGIWVAGAVRADATEADIDMLRGSALSGDWRMIGGQMRLVGLLVVNAPGFRVSRAMAASSALVTVGPGCDRCGEFDSLEERIARLEELLSQQAG